MSVMEHERRRYERHPLLRSVGLYQSSEELSTGRTVNLSPGGAYAIMRKPLALDASDAVIVRVSIPRRSPTSWHPGQVFVPARICRLEDLGNELAVALEFQQETDVT